MNFRRYVTHAAIRRVVYIVVGLVVYGLLSALGIGVSRAEATITVATCNVSEGCSREVAYSRCMSAAATAYGAAGSPGGWTPDCTGALDGDGSASGMKFYFCRMVNGSGGFNAVCTSQLNADKFYFPASAECPDGGSWNDTTHTCMASCAGKPNITNVSWTGDDSVCSGGCEYSIDIGTGGATGTLRGIGTGSSRKTFADVIVPTGGSCSSGETSLGTFDPSSPVCVSTGGSHNECVKTNGEHCVTSATGSSLCWSPGETGERMTTDGTEGANRQKPPATPTPPNNMDSPTNTSTTTTTINNTTYTTTTYTGTGNTGGQSEVGTGGKDKGGTGDDGDGEDDDGPGDAGSGVGELYDGEGKTVSDVFAAFKAGVEGTAIIGASTSFLTVSLSGSCPVWTVPETAFWSAMTFDYHCTGELADALALGAYLLLAIAAYTAFKIAVY